MKQSTLCLQILGAGRKRRKFLLPDCRPIAVVVFVEPVAALRRQGNDADGEGGKEGAQEGQVGPVRPPGVCPIKYYGFLFYGKGGKIEEKFTDPFTP